MKLPRITFPNGLLLCALAVLSISCASSPKVAVKPYTLNFCAVCDMKLTAEDKPYSFVYEGREIKVCDKDEAAVFKKDPAKYLKIIEAAEAKANAAQ